MAKRRNRLGSKGIAALDTFLVIIIVGIVGAAGYWAATQRSSSSSAEKQTTDAKRAAAVQPGTSAAIDRLTDSDGQAEAAIDEKYELTEQSDVTSTNEAQNNIGGAYDESSL